MREKILKYICERVGEQSAELDGDSKLEDIVDSITFVNIVVDIEDEFDFEFEDDMLIVSKFETVNDFINYVLSLVEE